jgi:dolichol-phosphate mannosyltransferase
MSPTVDLSIVIPFLDEAPNLGPLHAELVPVLNALGPQWEILYVDDGSTDEGPAIAAALAAADARVRSISLARNYGQSTALVAGVEAARGEWIATLDGDGQSGEAQMVNGVRMQRVDSWVRRVSSKIANTTRNRLSGDIVTDVGCSLRIFPRQAFLSAVRFEGMHRFLPTLLSMQGVTIVEREVSHRPRRAGESKYGINNRLWRGLADLLMLRRLRQGSIEYEVRETSAATLGKEAPQ